MVAQHTLFYVTRNINYFKTPAAIRLSGLLFPTEILILARDNISLHVGILATTLTIRPKEGQFL